MSPMLWGDVLDDNPWLPGMLRRRFRAGLILGLISGLCVDQIVRWVA